MSDSNGKKSKISVVIFALMVSVICSLLITAAAVGLKPRQLANMELDKKINLLNLSSDKATVARSHLV